jgi:hypothetical protein
MMKKLLATSALVSTLALTNVSFAQTTITGSLDLTLRNTSNSVGSASSARSDSETTMGRETQINIANKGKLNNGLDYAAGFSIEFDGNNNHKSGTNNQNSDSNENVYLNIISGGTTFHVGIDHIQNSQNDLLNATGDFIDEVGAGTISGLLLDNVGFRSPKEDIGVGIIQNFGNGITASALFTPNNTNVGTGNNGTATVADTGSNSATEFGIRGTNVANSGISFDIWKNNIEKNEQTAKQNDEKGLGLSLNYNTGPFGVGIAQLKNDRGTTSGAATTTTLGSSIASGGDEQEVKTKMGHLTYAVSKELTASLVYAKTQDSRTTATADEKVKTLMIGYNFGPVGLLVTGSKVENIGGLTSSGDVDALGISLNTRF